MALKNKIMNKAFSLVELIVWITISMILMVSVGIFVNSWMQNIFIQQAAINNASNLNDFAKDVYNTFWNLENTWSIHLTNSWIVIKSAREFDKWWFSYVWITQIDEYFCWNDSEESITNHVYIKNFIPFEESGESINSPTWYLDILTWSVTHNSINYISYQKEHKITDDSWNIIIWKWVFWDSFNEGVAWTWIYLNSPTWMASDWDVLYISDTLNNRVLYLSWWLIYNLLDDTAWLKEPTWLYYNNLQDMLYISNSWKWEILRVSSENISTPDKTLSFSWVTENNISEIYIDFFKNWQPHNINSLNIDTSDFNNDSDDDKNYNNNVLSYSFMSWASIETKNFNSWNTYDIELSNINNFSEPWNYSIKLVIWSTEKMYYFFTQWDDKIYTKWDNKIITYNSGLDYPTWITSPSNINEFDINNLNDLKVDKFNDIILKSPVESLNVSNDSWLINIILKYYKNYNCYNTDLNNSKVRTFLSKININ